MPEKELDVKQMRKYRKQLFVDALNKNTKPERIPLASNAWTWKICDAGMKLSEALHDYDKLFYVVCRHHEKYGFDMYMDLGTRNPLSFIDSLGKNIYRLDDEKNQLSYCFDYPMEENDYPELLQKGVRRYFTEDVLPKKYGWKSRQEYMQHIAAGLEAYLELERYADRIRSKMTGEYGVCHTCLKKPVLPIEVLMTSLRGVRGIAVDFCRNKNYLDDALALIYKAYYSTVEEGIANRKDAEDCYFLFRLTTMSHNLMNPKQFERYSWPYINDIAQKVSSMGERMLIFAEGSMKHLLDYFKELPENSICLYSEMDEIRLLKKELPNLTVAGGYPVRYLAEGDLGECIDEAKRLIDDVGYDGNYIFGCNKMLSYPDDALGENMLAVNEFLKEYAVF